MQKPSKINSTAIFYFSCPWVLIALSKTFSNTASRELSLHIFLATLAVGCLLGHFSYLSFFNKKIEIKTSFKEVGLGALIALTLSAFYYNTNLFPQEKDFAVFNLVPSACYILCSLIIFKKDTILLKAIIVLLGCILQLPFYFVFKLWGLSLWVNSSLLIFSCGLATLFTQKVNVQKIFLNSCTFLIIAAIASSFLFSSSTKTFPHLINLSLTGILLTWGIYSLYELTKRFNVINALFTIPVMPLVYISFTNHLNNQRWPVIIPILLISVGILTIISSLEDKESTSSPSL